MLRLGDWRSSRSSSPIPAQLRRWLLDDTPVVGRDWGESRFVTEDGGPAGARLLAYRCADVVGYGPADPACQYAVSCCSLKESGRRDGGMLSQGGGDRVGRGCEEEDEAGYDACW